MVFSEKEGFEARILLAVLVVESVIGAASAALRPIETDIHPVDNIPPNWKASDRRATIVFFFAGSCATGSPAQFAATAEYSAARGFVATAPEYRIESVHRTRPERYVEDGKSAIRWLRTNARQLGIDTRHVIAGGGSSGAGVAAFTAYNTAFELDDEDRSISPEPNALVPLNPAFGCPPGQSSQGAPRAVQRRPTDHLVLRHGRSAPRCGPRLRPAIDRRREPRGVLHRRGPTARLLQSLPRIAMARSRAPAD